MAVKYVVVEKGNPGNPAAPKKWYAQAKSGGELTFKTLSREIAEGSTTVSDTDVLAVLNDLTKILKRHLSNGEIVRFGDFGSFQISLSGEGAEAADKYHHSMIKASKVVFRPGIDLKEMQNNLKYEKL
ncbi:MAG: HU family DNA-binding protein [Prevotellaceae bacterium]|jgi:predicted histone-like DNA-binding protein|nr:HU family DNA-binding protein [Prevotellaceae bacterium]